MQKLRYNKRNESDNMIDKPIELWARYPDFDFIEGSSFGRIRTVDRYVLDKRFGERLIKGRILRQRCNRYGYLYFGFGVNGKNIYLSAHRVIASCFLPNPLDLSEVNHKDNDPLNNNVSNLEWCSREYNVAYREKYGKSAKESVPKSPVYAVNLNTLEISRFESQHEASRELGISYTDVNGVITGRYKYTGSYWLTKDNGDGFKIDKNKLYDIKSGMRFTGGIYAININTQVVSYFDSQTKAERILGFCQQNISKVLKRQYNQTHGYWFTYADHNAVDNTRLKFGNYVASKVEHLINEKMN